ncbi:MAG: hypothetical protein SFY81_07780 [Verrucomicrobiota bacterium]|nr:hypothetical protein [Verrucomicrobiota bacterium]
MTWKDVMGVLAKEFQMLRAMPVPHNSFANAPAGTAEKLHLTEQDCAVRVEGMIRHFAEAGEWMEMSDKERFFLRERIRFAHEFASISSISTKSPWAIVPKPISGRQETRVLEWLLIDVWHRSGRKNWITPVYRLAEVDRRYSPSKAQISFSE